MIRMTSLVTACDATGRNDVIYYGQRKLPYLPILWYCSDDISNNELKTKEGIKEHRYFVISPSCADGKYAVTRVTL